MNKLSTEKRVQILGMLVEGVSMRAISLTGASINTVTKLLTDAADAAEAYHAEHVRGIRGSRHIQCDEIWSFVYAKEAHVPRAKGCAAGSWRRLAVHGAGYRKQADRELPCRGRATASPPWRSWTICAPA